jgi:hypothetical protein
MYNAKRFYVRYKIMAEKKLKKGSSRTSLQEDLSINVAEPHGKSCWTVPLNVKKNSRTRIIVEVVLYKRIRTQNSLR